MLASHARAFDNRVNRRNRSQQSARHVAQITHRRRLEQPQANLLRTVTDRARHGESLLNDRKRLFLAAATVEEIGTLEECLREPLVIARRTIQMLGFSERGEGQIVFPSCPSKHETQSESSCRVGGIQIQGALERGGGALGVVHLLREPPRLQCGRWPIGTRGLGLDLLQEWRGPLVLP